MTAVLNVETTSVNNELNNEEITMTDSITANVSTTVNDELIKEETAVNKEITNKGNTETDDTKLYDYIAQTNDAYEDVKKSNVVLFDTCKTAYFGLSSPVFKEFKKEVNLSSSTINKMVKIFDCKAICNNSVKLPKAWSVLHLISMMEDNDIIEAIENNTFNSKTTQKEVEEYKIELKLKQEMENVEDKIYGTDDDAYPESESEIIKNNFLVKLSSIYNVKNEINEENYSEIHQAFKILKHFFEITPNVEGVKK